MSIENWVSGSNLLVIDSSTQPILLTIIFLLIVLIISFAYQRGESKRRKLLATLLFLILIGSGILIYAFYGPFNIDYTIGVNIQGSVPIRVVLTVLTFVLTYISTVALDAATQKMVQKGGKQVVDDHRREVIFRILQLTMYIFVAIGMLNYWRVDIRSILIGAGALAAIIGLSARHTLSAALAGIVLLFSRPFKVGDWIQIGETEGTVRRITIVNTIMQTPRDEEVIIPNDVIGEKKIKNKNNSDKLRVSASTEVSYEESTDRVLRLLETSVSDCDIVADIPEPTAHVEDFNSSGLVVDLHFWIRRPTPRRRTVAKANVNKIIKDSFDENNVEIPYPKRDIIIDHESKPRELHITDKDESLDTEDRVVASSNDD